MSKGGYATNLLSKKGTVHPQGMDAYVTDEILWFFCCRIAHCKNKVVVLAKYLVTTIVWLSLLCKFYESSAGKEFMQ